MNLPDRKRRILKAIIENYIDTAEPVGSKLLAVSFDQPISSATIRNEMSELEDMGLLEKPHISAGRIPSYQAYRLYVNELMDSYRVASEEIELIRAQMNAKMRELDNIMLSASKVVSHMTGHTALSMSSQSVDSVKKCELITVDDGTSYAVVLVLASSVKNRMIHLSAPVEPSTAAVITTAINLAIAENRLDYLLPSMANSMGEHSPVYDLTRQTLEFISQTAEGSRRSEVYVEGVSRLLDNREYQDTNRARALLESISDHGKLRNTLQSGAANIVNIRIGPELDDPSLHDASLMFSTYSVDRHTRGIIGIIAPTRMDYAQACAKLLGFIQAVGGSPPGPPGNITANTEDTGESDD